MGRTELFKVGLAGLFIAAIALIIDVAREN